MEVMAHESEKSQEQPDPTAILAALPSYLFFPSLRIHFANPDNAFQRGIFQRIKAEALDLPSHRNTPDSEQHKLWLAHLPKPLENIFSQSYESYFVKPLYLYASIGRQEGTLPKPKVHATDQQYIKLLDRAGSSGMISWSVVNEEESDYSELADAIQLTLFAVSKSETRSRLISWPRVQNAALPDPPYTSLPNPSMFEAIQLKGDHTSAFYLDIANMFHNITLPHWLAKLFPMKPVHLRQLSAETISSILEKHPQLKTAKDPIIRPCQATMPMGFKWAVYIAHTFVNGCLKQAYALFRASRFAPKNLGEVQTMCAEQAPVTLTQARPLLLHIINDVTATTVDWADTEIKNWYRITRRVLTVHGLPISERKSCPPDTVERKAIEFIGCLWDLTTMRVTPSPDKLAIVINQASHLLTSTTVAMSEWERIIGRLVWLATLNRPLLSCLQRIFAYSQHKKQDGVINIPDGCKKELRTLFPLLPLAAVEVTMPVTTMLLAFDASLEAGAVTRTFVQPQVAQNLWAQAQATKLNRALQANYEMPAVKLVANACTWSKLVSHCWINREHINALEAAAAVLSLECAVRAGARNTRIVILTDSLVVFGALQNGRSSSPPLLARCRRFAAIALAHNLRISLAYVAPRNNPADKYTREGRTAVMLRRTSRLSSRTSSHGVEAPAGSMSLAQSANRRANAPHSMHSMPIWQFCCRGAALFRIKRFCFGNCDWHQG